MNTTLRRTLWVLTTISAITMISVWLTFSFGLFLVNPITATIMIIIALADTATTAIAINYMWNRTQEAKEEKRGPQ